MARVQIPAGAVRSAATSEQARDLNPGSRSPGTAERSEAAYPDVSIRFRSRPAHGEVRDEFLDQVPGEDTGGRRHVDFDSHVRVGAESVERANGAYRFGRLVDVSESRFAGFPRRPEVVVQGQFDAAPRDLELVAQVVAQQ